MRPKPIAANAAQRTPKSATGVTCRMRNVIVTKGTPRNRMQTLGLMGAPLRRRLNHQTLPLDHRGARPADPLALAEPARLPDADARCPLGGRKLGRLRSMGTVA